MVKILDTADRRILAALAEDGQAGAGELAERLGVTAPTIRTRMKSLISQGLLRVAGMVDPFQIKGLTVALVGIKLMSHMQLDKKLTEIADLPDVNWAAVVTGRYDILVEIVLGEDISGLYGFLDRDLSGVGGIASSESFVVMKARRKWIPLPRGARTWFAENTKTAENTQTKSEEQP
ncbi:MAG: Lrp/AsnC family transcriptional regulator [Proteobacteria bacterium]|nr:Lrp/AsnC family transcriptional regulator [Pseudomonadota bacterium]MBU1595649.1 Lrp/AsnC family transcriptional regulator [Pseudomonadota bacterium]